MSQINHIKDLSNYGYRISEISKETGTDPKTTRKYLSQEDFSPHTACHGGKTIHSRPIQSCHPGVARGRQETLAQAAPYRQKGLRAAGGRTGIYRQLQHRAALSEKMQGPAGRKRNLELIWYPGPAQVYLGEANFTGPGKPCWKNTLPCLFPTAMTTTAMCSEGRQRSVSARGF